MVDVFVKGDRYFRTGDLLRLVLTYEWPTFFVPAGQHTLHMNMRRMLKDIGTSSIA